MALTPREVSCFYPGTVSPSPRQSGLQAPTNFQALSFGISKFPSLSPIESIRPMDGNLSLLFQNWLINTLRGIPGILPNIGELNWRNIPTSPILPSVTEQYRQNFILQDLHQRYLKLQKDYGPFMKAKSDFKDAFSNDNLLNPAPQNSLFCPFPQLPGFQNPICFPFSSPSLEKCQKVPHVPFSTNFYTTPSQKLSSGCETGQTSTVHHRRHDVKDEEESQNRLQTTDTFKDKKTHKCMYCGKLYSRKYGLKIHIRTHTGYKPLKCKVCGRPFGDPSNLNKHVRLHAEGDTPYRCEFCGKVLVRRRDLERHIKSRHPNAVSNIDMFSDTWKIPTQ